MKCKMNAFFLLLAGLVLCASCTEDENTSRADVALYFNSSSVAPVASSGVSTDLVISQALIGIRKIELKSNGAKQRNRQKEYNFEGPYVIDLLAGLSDPKLPLSEAAPGIYHQAESELVPVIGDSLSVLIRGMAGDRPFTFLWKNTQGFRAKNEQGFSLSSGSWNNVLIHVDLHSLFEGVDFQQAMTNDRGEIILSKDNNRELADIVEKNIKTASEIALDQDADRHPD